jgi:hypothetical protein
VSRYRLDLFSLCLSVFPEFPLQRARESNTKIKFVFAVLGDVWDWREGQGARLHAPLPPNERESAARQKRHTGGLEVLLALAGAEIREEQKSVQESAALRQGCQLLRMGHWTVAEGESNRRRDESLSRFN